MSTKISTDDKKHSFDFFMLSLFAFFFASIIYLPYIAVKSSAAHNQGVEDATLQARAQMTTPQAQADLEVLIGNIENSNCVENLRDKNPQKMSLLATEKALEQRRQRAQGLWKNCLDNQIQILAVSADPVRVQTIVQLTREVL